MPRRKGYANPISLFVNIDETCRALSAAEVKMAGAPVWVHALDEPGVYLTD